MHEVSLTRNLVEIAEDHARSSGYDKILSVSVAVGELSGVVAEAMEFCFETVTRGTLLEDGELIIQRIPGRKSCLDCRHQFAADNMTFQCPACGSYLLDTVQGDELKILEMEVE